MELGKVQWLYASRNTEHGFYLTDDAGYEVLLPGVYVPEGLKAGEEIQVFLYKDSSDRMVATTICPKIKLNEVAVLTVKEVGRFGAFVDWGLPKDLLIPFAEQNIVMRAGYKYPVYLYLDQKTERLVGSAKINKYLAFDNIELETGQEVSALLTGKNELGVQAVVDQKYYGLIFHSDVHKSWRPGDTVSAWVKNIREDGKIDLSFEPMGYEHSIDVFTIKLLNVLKANNGKLNLTDKSSPESIQAVLGMSKKAFKKAVGKLYKDGTLFLGDNEIILK